MTYTEKELEEWVSVVRPAPWGVSEDGSTLLLIDHEPLYEDEDEGLLATIEGASQEEAELLAAAPALARQLLDLIRASRDALWAWQHETNPNQMGVWTDVLAAVLSEGAP